MRRTFTALEIAKILKSQNVLEFDLADELQAIQMAKGDGLIWTIVSKAERRNRKFLDKSGNPKFLDELDTAELAAISTILWEKISPQFIDSKEILDAELTPENLKGEDDEDILIPDDLRQATDPAKRALDDLLTPSHLVDIEQNPGIARKLAQGEGTLDDLLTPDEFVDGVEDESLEGQLTPDRLRDDKK